MTQSLAIVVLAGGRSSRLGGGDKTLLELGGRTVLDHVLARIGSSGHAIAINANGAASRFESYRLPVIPDQTGGYAGPLAGVEAGLAWLREQRKEYLLTVSGDTPFLPDDLVSRMQAEAGGGRIIVASSNGRVHPTIAMWPGSLLGDLRQFLLNGGRKVVDFVESRPNATLTFAATILPGGAIDPFFNINTPEDLAVARRLVETSRG